MALGADARASLRQDLAAGYVVVAPNRPVMLAGRPVIGWWRVDPTTGQSLGVDDRGWGQDIVEYAFIAFHTALCIHAASELAGKAPSPRKVAAGLAIAFCVAFGGFAGVGLSMKAKGLMHVFEALQLLTEIDAVKTGPPNEK